MTTKKPIFHPSTSDDPVQRASEALRAVQQYQEDWQDYGVERVHLYFDEVEGEWLEQLDAELSDPNLKEAFFQEVNVEKAQLENSKGLTKR